MDEMDTARTMPAIPWVTVMDALQHQNMVTARYLQDTGEKPSYRIARYNAADEAIRSIYLAIVEYVQSLPAEASDNGR